MDRAPQFPGAGRPRHVEERRAAVLVKARPHDRAGTALVLRDHGVTSAQHRHQIEFRAPTFHLHDGQIEHVLDGVVWADWAPDGRLTVATDTGMIELRELGDRGGPGGQVHRAHDLSALRPAPEPAPGWARRW